MGLAKCVQVGFLVFLCLIICSASRLLLDSADFKEAKNGQSHVASATTVGDGSGSLGLSLNMAHAVHSEPIKKIGEANMVHSEPIINPFSFDSTLKKNKVGEAHSEPIINPFSFHVTLKKESRKAHVVHSEPTKKIGEANVAQSEPTNPFSFDINLVKTKVGNAHVVHSEPIKKVGEANVAHSEPIINPFSFEFPLKEKQDGEGEARSTNQRAVSEPEQLVNAVHKIEDGLLLQEAAPPLY
ncbi:Hypothetical predicted protein [Olea europaea subsp. europaea]|uniref:Uncharacterized protein n=1 Tax=Olea europaea subsp. europaea TaxID=158383 RepID=A0A8S0TTS5_OLEEU|nr:Hypothetical predicted protein [Olea europaea subsp. europaea]